MNGQKNPLFSVVINCYNGEAYLCETINSVIAQTYTNWEIIFWDNCSTDLTTDIIKSFKDKRIRYYRSEHNVALGVARNLALSKATGEYIAFLDADDIWMPELLSHFVDAFSKDNSLGIVYCRYLIFGTIHKELNQRYDHDSVISLKELIKRYNIGMSGAAVRMDLVKQHNIIFNENFSLIEDYDYFLRIATIAKVLYIHYLGMKYRVHENNLSLRSNDWTNEIEVLIALISKGHENYISLQSYILLFKELQIRYELIDLIRRKCKKEALLLILKNIRCYPSLWHYILPSVLGLQYSVIVRCIRYFSRVRYFFRY